MARTTHAMLAIVAFTYLVLTASATMEKASFKKGQEKTYDTPAPTVDPLPPTIASPPPSASPSPGSCSFWSKAHPSSLPDLLSFITPILDIFSSGSSGSSSSSSSIQAITSIFGSKTTLHQGLTNTRTDGYGALLRQGSAAVLNSYTSRGFPYTPAQVKSAFRGALVSQQAASVTAIKLENANLGYGARH